MDVRGHEFRDHSSAWGTSDEKIFMTRTVCRTIVLFRSLGSDTCNTRCKDSKNEKEENVAVIVAPVDSAAGCDCVAVVASAEEEDGRDWRSCQSKPSRMLRAPEMDEPTTTNGR